MTNWSLLAEGGLTPLGQAAEGPPVVLVADPDIVLHRVRLLARKSGARLAEARAIAADLSATPVERLHLALGAPDRDGSQWLAIVAQDRMEAHLARLAETGEAPDRLVPAASLLADPVGEAQTPGPEAVDRIVAARCGDRVLVKGDRFAGIVEPGLAAYLGAEAHPPALEALLPTALPDLALNLLQGAYAPPRSPWKDRRYRLAVITLLALSLVFALVPLANNLVRSRIADEAMDTATLALASRALGQELADASAAEAAIRQEAAGLPEAGLADRLALALQAIEREPNVSLAALSFAADPGLVLTLSGPPEAINRVASALGSTPWTLRQEGERLILGTRRPTGTRDGASEAEARLARVRELAPAVAAARRAPSAPAAARLSSALTSAGLVSEVSASGNSASTQLEAVRAGLLLPLIARLETTGTWITGLDVSRNDDPSLRVQLEVR